MYYDLKKVNLVNFEENKYINTLVNFEENIYINTKIVNKFFYI